MQIEWNKERIVERFLHLVAIDNPSLQERKMADEVKNQLRALGIEPSEDDTWRKTGGNAGNIFARWEGELPGEPLLFSAHLDSVAPALKKEGIISAGKITSKGDTVLGADDLAGITAILEAIRHLKENKIPHRTLELLFTCAEELYDVGSEQFDYSQIQAKEAYILDSSGEMGSFIYKAPTILGFTATIQGKAAHAGFRPEAGIHAIGIAAKAIASQSMGKVDGETTVNIGEISGGTGTNIVPKECTVKGEIRSQNHEKALEQLKRLQENFQKCAKEEGGALEFTSRVGCHAYETALESPVVERFRQVCKERGLSFSPKVSFGGSDNNQFAPRGVEGIVLACGMNNVHSTEEYLMVEDLLEATAIVASLAVK